MSVNIGLNRLQNDRYIPQTTKSRNDKLFQPTYNQLSLIAKELVIQHSGNNYTQISVLSFLLLTP